MFLIISDLISYVKSVTVLYDENCDRKFQSRYCVVTDRKTARASEIVFGFLLYTRYLSY